MAQNKYIDSPRPAASSLRLLTVFRSLLTDPLVAQWLNCRENSDNCIGATAYCTLIGQLLEQEADLPQIAGCNLWQRYLARAIAKTENVFTYTAERSGPVLGSLREAALHDLRNLEQAFRFESSNLVESALPSLSGSAHGVQVQGVEQWLAHNTGWAQHIDELCEAVKQYGTGELAFHWACTFADGEIQGVSYADEVGLDNLYEYEDQRRLVVENTVRFASGYPAQHLLLYGDRGTGKSATVKAAVAAMQSRKVRLIEIDRRNLHTLPQLLEQLRQRAYRFILFVDDLSFIEGEDALHHLKVLLEGTVQATPENVLLYATSNRRHLVSESIAERETEIRPGDVVQEKLALADRFGRTVVFTAPTQDEYVHIVQAMADKVGIPIEPHELRQKALTWAMRENGRSVRTAKQFVTELCGEMGIPTNVAALLGNAR